MDESSQSATSKVLSEGDSDDAIDSDREEPGGGDGVTKAAKKYVYEAYEPFKELVGSPIFTAMEEYAGNIVPLSLVGTFMNFVGNHLLAHIYKVYGQKIFHPFHKVVSIQTMANGEFQTTCTRRLWVTLFTCV